MIRRIALAAALAAITLSAAEKETAAKYRDAANKLIDAAMADEAGLNRLQYLCYRVGSRLSGSRALDQAIQFAEASMIAADLDNVHRIPVTVPNWVRGAESADMLEPVQKPLAILGLGGSVATPKDGITADVVAVSNFDELEKLGRAGVEGRIVLFDAPFVTYDETVVYRSTGAVRAAQYGAVAVLVRSVTPRSLGDPHTGAMSYTANDPRIPAAAVSLEDAIWIHRLYATQQKIRVHLAMTAHYDEDADSADVIGQITGREKPEEVVVIGGHLDSWDVGQGAHDDGAGAMAALEAVALMKKLGLQPRRTLRVVLWTNEENGGRGGVGYQEWTKAQGEKTVAAIEMDGGAEKPVGFDFADGGRKPRGSARETSAAAGAPGSMMTRVNAISELLRRIEANKVLPGNGEADIAPLMADGAPGLGLRTVMTHYFDYHHSAADTFDKVAPDDFKRCVAAMAVMSYALADWPQP